MIKLCIVLLIFSSLVSGMGCGGPRSSQSDTPSSGEVGRSQADAKTLVLVAEDLEALKSFSAQGLSQSNSGSRSRFVQVFGGYSGKNIRSFIDERIKYFISLDDLLPAGRSSSGPSSNGKRGNSDQESGPTPGWTRIENSEKIKDNIAASNFGFQLWLQSLIDRRPTAVVLKSRKLIPVTSSRVGIMLIGPAYNGITRNLDDSPVPFPQEYRQSMLIHEARHSDCVGGLTQEDLRIAREASSYAEFSERFSSKKCGHLHALCMTGDFKGFPACDSMRWGSYGIQALYLEAALQETPIGSEKWQVLLASFIDSKSRLFFDYDEDMIQGLEDPELNSLGLR